MKSLVTGACGFVGPHLIKHLIQEGDTVAGVIKNPDHQGDLACRIYTADLCDTAAVEEVLEEFKPDRVFHLAGMSFVPQAEKDFSQALKLNVSMTEEILRGVQKIVPNATVLYVSSAEVYGRDLVEGSNFTETSPLLPANNYGLSKVMAELVCQKFSRSGLRVVIARPFNHIGPGQDSRFVASNFALQISEFVMRKKPPVIRVGNLESERDFTDVRDIVRGYGLAAEKGENGQVYNLCSGRAVKISEILETLINQSGANIDIQTDSERMARPDAPRLTGSYERSLQVLGWKPELTLAQSLIDQLNYWIQFQKKSA